MANSFENLQFDQGNNNNQVNPNDKAIQEDSSWFGWKLYITIILLLLIPWLIFSRQLSPSVLLNWLQSK